MGGDFVVWPEWELKGLSWNSLFYYTEEIHQLSLCVMSPVSNLLKRSCALVVANHKRLFCGQRDISGSG